MTEVTWTGPEDVKVEEDGKPFPVRQYKFLRGEEVFYLNIDASLPRAIDGLERAELARRLVSEAP